MSNTAWHLFEFQDHASIPPVLRSTLLDILEFCNGPVRGYYDQVCSIVKAEAERHGSRQIVELGAGSAPLTTRLAADPDTAPRQLVACDLYPDREYYRSLEALYDGRVRGVLEPIDFSIQRDWEPDTLLILCATFHHVPPALRRQTLAALSHSAARVLVFEPIQNNFVSMFFVLTSVFPALVSPLWFSRPGALRRVLWCWLVPIVPLMFVWDGLVSCLRQWQPDRWKMELDSILPAERSLRVEAQVHAAIIGW